MIASSHAASPDSALDDLLVLEQLARRLAKTYPPDRLEIHGSRLYGAMLVVCFAIYLYLSLVHAVWWCFLIPIVVPPCIAYVPAILLGRMPGHPRWAHPRAAIDRSDMDIVHRIIRAASREQQAELMHFHPAHTGDRVFAVLAFFRERCSP